MITTDGAGFSHKLLQHLDKLASRRGFTLIYSCGWELDQREKAAIRLVPQDAWQIAVDHRGEVRERRADDACADPGCGHRGCWIEEAHVAELTGLLRHRPDGDRLAGWPQMMRIFARRERPHPARNSRCSSTRTGTGTSCGSPTSPQAPEDGAASALTSTPRTASTPGSRTPSAPGKTPGSAGSPLTASRSIRPG